MALAAKAKQNNDKIIALVGDASIVNGTSFRGVKQSWTGKRQMLIVLNDNSMAIDPTQGAVATYFSKIRLSHTYESMRKTTNNILEHIPVLGKGVEEALAKIKKSIRMVQPAGQMFESLNIPYFGPVDGHDIGSLMRVFKALAIKLPGDFACLYQKRQRFHAGGQDPGKFHSTGPFVMNGDAVEHVEAEDQKSFTIRLRRAIWLSLRKKMIGSSR